MRRDFRYTDASGSQHGLMVCGACHRKIETGPYRYRETEEAFIVHHRACSESDPEWAKQDQENAARLARQAALLAACKAFRAEWGVDDLDDLIRSLTP